MKKLFTSFYHRSPWLNPRALQVQTSRTAPKNWSPNRRMVCMELAPSAAILEMSRKRLGDWRDAYRRQLQRLLDSGRLAKIVQQLSPEAILLCYESNPEDCHRSILASFLTEHGLAEVVEAPSGSSPPRPPTTSEEDRVLL